MLGQNRSTPVQGGPTIYIWLTAIEDFEIYGHLGLLSRFGDPRYLDVVEEQT